MSSGLALVGRPENILIVGARKFIFSEQVLSSKQVHWWGTTEDDNVVENIPSNLAFVFVRRGLARSNQIKSKVSSLGSKFAEFGEDFELFPLLKKTLGIEPDRSKAPALKKPGYNLDTEEDSQPEPAKDMKLSGDKVIDVLVSRIRRFEGQPRTYFSDAELLRLGRSMLSGGQQIPVILVPVKGDKDHDYQIYDGERRWRAALKVKKPTLRAIIAESISDAKLFEGSAICNVGRAGYQDMEIAISLERIKREQKVSNDELATRFCNSVSWVTSHLQLLKLDPSIQALLNPDLPDEERISFVAAVEIAKVPIHAQSEAIQHIKKHKLNIDQIRHYMRHLVSQVGQSNDAGRKRRPDDDYKIFTTFLKHAQNKSDQMLDLPGGLTLNDIFKRRSWVERDHAAEDIVLLIKKLNQMRTQILQDRRPR